MPNTMMTYIKKTPSRIDYVAKNSKKLTKKLVDLFLEEDYKRIVMVACGSSFNGATCSSAFIKKYLKVDTKVITPTEFMYGDSNVYENDFVLFFSQSGCSTNTIDAMDFFKKKHHKVIGITGNLNGDFKDHADEVINWCCGEETVGFVTIGLTILVLFLMEFVKEASFIKGTINKATYDSLNKDFTKLSKAYGEVETNTEKLIKNNPQEFSSITSIYSIGFTQGYAVCHEGALKLAETIKKPSILQEAEEFAHGPNNSITPNSTCFFIDSFDASSKRLIELYNATRKITNKAYILTNSKTVDNLHAVRIKIDIKEKLLLPIYALAFFQTIAYVVTDNLDAWSAHPLLKDFKKIANTKTSSLLKVMPDYEVKK